MIDPTGISHTKCEKPGCTNDPEKTYTGEHDNDLRLCGKHYYRLVTGRAPSTITDTGIPNTRVSTDWFSSNQGTTTLDHSITDPLED